MQRFVGRVGEKYLTWYRDSPLVAIFVTILAIFLAANLVMVLVCSSDYLIQLIDEKGSPWFMDHFNSMLYSMDDPYGYWKVIYPPFITTIYGILGRACLPFTDVMYPDDFRNERLGFDFHDSWVSMVLFAVIFALCLSTVLLLFRKVTEGRMKQWQTEALFLMVLLSTPFAYAVARGNSIVICLAFVVLFLLGYKSKNKWIRYASYLALACSVGVKITTVFLGLLLIRDRRWKDVIMCIALCAAMFFLPFLATGGGPGDLISCIFGHVRSVEPDYSQITVSQWVLLLNAVLPAAVVNVIRYAAMAALFALSFITILFDRDLAYWKQLVVLCALCVVGLGVGIRYYFVFMAIPLIYFLMTEKEMTWRNLVFVVAFALMFVLIPAVPQMMSLSVFVMLGVIMYDSLSNIKRTVR